MFLIEKNLYQGGIPTENKEEVEFVLSLIRNNYTKSGDEYKKLQNVNHLSFPIEDGLFPGIRWLKTVVETVEVILKNDYKILVHCREGVSRSAMVTAAYLMKKYLINHETALNNIAQINSRIDPNPRFVEGLKKWFEFLVKGR